MLNMKAGVRYLRSYYTLPSGFSRTFRMAFLKFEMTASSVETLNPFTKCSGIG